MIRFSTIIVCIVSLSLIAAIVSGAGNKPAQPVRVVVEISAIQVQAKATTQGSDPLALPGRRLEAVEHDQGARGADGSFLSEATLGDRVIHLSGKLKSSDDASCGALVEYSDKSTSSVQSMSITSEIMLPLGEAQVLGGMNGGETRSLLVLNLREYKPAEKQ